MTLQKASTTAVTLVLALILSAGSATAQGKAKGKEAKSRERVEQRSGDRYDDRGGIFVSRPDLARGNGSGKVPPGWCRGVGNPHNTPENCGYASRDGRGRDDRPVRNDRGRSYEQAHDDFHWELDRRYERLAAQRPLDPRWQLEIRARKRAEHEDWHARMGRRHD